MNKDGIENELNICYEAVSCAVRDSYVSIFEKLRPRIHLVLNQLKENKAYPLDLNISFFSYSNSEGGFLAPQVSHYWFPTVNSFDVAYRNFDNFVGSVASVSGNVGVMSLEVLANLRDLFDLLNSFENIAAPGKECQVTYTSETFSHHFKIFIGNKLYEFETVNEVLEELED